MHLICPPPPPPPPQILHNPLFFISPGYYSRPKRNWKQGMRMQNFGGEIRCIMGDVQVAYIFFVISPIFLSFFPILIPITLFVSQTPYIRWLLPGNLFVPILFDAGFNNFSNSTIDGEKFRGGSCSITYHFWFHTPLLSLLISWLLFIITTRYISCKGKRQKGGWCEWICERSLLENSKYIRFTFVCGLIEMYEKKTK